jgi:ketosteroid isomerase-like protein
MKRFFYFAIILLIPFYSFSQNNDEAAIRRLLNDQTIAWNNGDLTNFMNGYWESDSLLFIGKKGPKYGYKTTLENYQKNYPDTATMGKLSFDILQIKRLSVLYFFVVGKWHLQRSIGDVEGHYTLLIRKIKGKWKIVADHSS